LPTHFSSVRTP